MKTTDTKYTKQKKAMQQAWKYVKVLGMSLSEALKSAWYSINRAKREAQERLKVEAWKAKEVAKSMSVQKNWAGAVSASPASVEGFYKNNKITRD